MPQRTKEKVIIIRRRVIPKIFQRTRVSTWPSGWRHGEGKQLQSEAADPPEVPNWGPVLLLEGRTGPRSASLLHLGWSLGTKYPDNSASFGEVTCFSLTWRKQSTKRAEPVGLPPLLTCTIFICLCAQSSQISLKAELSDNDSNTCLDHVNTVPLLVPQAK